MCHVRGKGRPDQFFSVHSSHWKASKKWRALEELCCKARATCPSCPPAPAAWPKPSASPAPATTDVTSLLRHPGCGLQKTASAQGKSRSHPASASVKLPTSPCAMLSQATPVLPDGELLLEP